VRVVGLRRVAARGLVHHEVTAVRTHRFLERLDRFLDRLELGGRETPAEPDAARREPTRDLARHALHVRIVALRHQLLPRVMSPVGVDAATVTTTACA
jgi:hypothetical protein